MRNIILCMVFIVSTLQTTAQWVKLNIQYITWEQASFVATHEKKLVMVITDDNVDRFKRAVENNVGVFNIVNQNFITVCIDLDSSEGQEFEPKLLKSPDASIAMFMPYGDLLATVDIKQVDMDINTLRITIEKAQRMVNIKRVNSRSVFFADLSMEAAMVQAQENDRSVFVYLSANNHESLITENNVFTLDSVADAYNPNFINIKPKQEDIQRLVEKYDVTNLPAFLYLDKQGTLVLRANGVLGAKEFVSLSEQAQKKVLHLTSDAINEQREISNENYLQHLHKYELGNRESKFIKEFIDILIGRNDVGQISEIINSYINQSGFGQLYDSYYWTVYNDFTNKVEPSTLNSIIENREKFNELYGKEEVDKSIVKLWAIGLDRFVGVEDDKQTKDYFDIVKDVKLSNWKMIILDGKIILAEKRRAWKELSSLITEKLHVGELSDEELYRWGQLISQHSKDGNARYMIRQLLISRLYEIDEEDRLRGAEKIKSYKGVFQHLVNNLR